MLELAVRILSFLHSFFDYNFFVFLTDDTRQKTADFTSPRVCRSFLLDCCPNDILSATRMDMGYCNKVHDLALRADFEKASLTKKYFFELDVSIFF